MLGKIKYRGNGSILWRGHRDGVDTQFRIPGNGILEVVGAEENAIGDKTYICQITVDGVKYTNVKIPKVFADGDGRWFDFNAVGGGRRRKSHRRKSHRRKSRRRV
jgi:hypothetical protein